MALFNRNKSTELPNPTDEKSEADSLLEKLGPGLREIIKSELAPVQEQYTQFKSEFQAALNETREAERRAAEDSKPDEQKRAEREASLVALAVNANAQHVENEIARSIESQFPQILPLFREMCSKTAPAVKARPDYGQLCKNAVNQLIGEAVMKQGGLRVHKETGKFLIEDSLASTNSNEGTVFSSDNDWVDPHNPNRHETGLETIRKLGIDPVEFAKANRVM